MSVAQEQNWDEFLEKWPVSRVETMTLEEYSQVGNKDSFTYWLEQATRPIADIRGGDSSKFGIFNRKNAEEKENGRGRVYDGDYCWFEKYGATKEIAFQNIKDNILNIISAVKQRNLKEIEIIPTSDMFKWKIAFLYQDRHNPQIIAIFWKAMLDFLTKNKKLGYAETYEKIMQDRHKLPLFEYNDTLLQEYFIANPKQSYLTPSEANEILSRKYPDSYISREKMTVVTNESGREIALVLTGSKASIFIEIDPEQNGKFKFDFKSTKDVPNGKYTEQDGRHSGLKSQSKNLWLGHQIYYIKIGTAEELEKFCDWYEQNSDQSNVLESKVKTFLELWPIERLKNLTISDYHQAKNTACFISQVDSFDPTQGDPTMPCYFDIWEPIGLGDNDKYHNEKPYSWHKRLGDDSEQAFQQIKRELLNIIDAVQRRDLNAIDQIQFPKGLKWMIAFLYQDFNDPFIIPVVTETNIKRIGYTEFIKKPIPEFMPHLLAEKGGDEFFPYVEKLFALIRKDYLANKQKKQENEKNDGEFMTEQALNRILFGAAGTGKTYNTINHALAILQGTDIEAIKEKEKTEGRQKLKDDFDKLREEGRIEFVTFHQSFSYEDFVEGIRAETDNGNISYSVQPGIFKTICDRAKENKKVMKDLGVRSEANVWKLSIGDLSTRQYCFAHNQIRVGWGQTGDLSLEETKYSQGYTQFSSTDHHTLEQFTSGVEIGDVVVCLKSTSEICAVGVVTGDYFFDTQLHDEVREDYLHCRHVNWILKDLEFNIRALNGGVGLTLKTMYRLWRFTWNDLLQALNQAGYLLTQNDDVPEPYVLIIDEINRGNISRIFGELITLIEDTKRAGNDESLSVKLPYSKKEFSVPKNLYIIGTMNSSDRSLTGLDIALRRRFTFIEMQPNTQAIQNKEGGLLKISGKDSNGKEGEVTVADLLSVMNQRIEVLLDRDHCIGHANFMSLKKTPTLAHLADIFKQKIIPQLQEYFFDDWGKIDLVLNRNGMLAREDNSKISALFPADVLDELGYLNQKAVWKIKAEAFGDLACYQAILGTQVNS